MSRKLLALGLVLCIVSLVWSCDSFNAGSITGSGNLVTRQETATGFDRLNVSDGFTIDLRQADSFGLVIRIDDNLEKYLEVAKKGSTLHIGLNRNRPATVKNATLLADITMPEVIELDMSGGSHLATVGFESTGSLRFELSGGSGATFGGSAGDVTIDISGGSQADLSALVAANANVEASAGSQVTVNVTGALDADASGGSRVYYLGSPTLGRIEESSGSEVLRK